MKPCGCRPRPGPARQEHKGTQWPLWARCYHFGAMVVGPRLPGEPILPSSVQLCREPLPSLATPPGQILPPCLPRFLLSALHKRPPVYGVHWDLRWCPAASSGFATAFEQGRPKSPPCAPQASPTWAFHPHGAFPGAPYLPLQDPLLPGSRCYRHHFAHTEETSSEKAAGTRSHHLEWGADPGLSCLCRLGCRLLPQAASLPPPAVSDSS